MRIGCGYDIHRLVSGRKLFLGGVEIPAPFGEEGFSDGDALLHAIIDALFGAACLGDIGSHFPPGSEANRGISSRLLLRETARILASNGFAVCNLDSTVLLEAPRLLPYVDRIREAISSDLGIPKGSVSVKGKTKEGVDATGEGRAVEAYAVALVCEPDR